MMRISFTTSLLIAWLLAGSTVAPAQFQRPKAADFDSAAGAAPARPQRASADNTGTQDTGTHDMVLLLPSGPMHLRVEVTDAGKSLKAKRQEYMSQLMASLDVDKDGKLSTVETSKHPLFVTGRRFEGNKFLESLRARKSFSDRELQLAVERAAGQLITFRQNNALAEQDFSVFHVLDEDRSGLIERGEMRTAAARIAARDADFDQCITFNEFLDQVQADPMALAVNITDEPPSSIHSDMLRDATEPTIAQRMVRHYDTDRDARLSAKELGWTAERFRPLDLDRNELLSVQELAGVARSEPDLWLAIELSMKVDQSLTIKGGRLAKRSEQARSDLVRIKHEAFELSVGYQARDVMAESEANASAAFNEIDVDSNGYLDRDEIMDHQRFERYLFDAMDTNSDDRVFADEMLAYVKAYSEPAGTSCQATLFDASNGFFQVLDDNADGRISIRELRQTENLLLKRSDGRQELNPSRMMKSYRIEFQRGGVSLFGRVNRPQAETPEALLKSPTGPIWFQRMDRNSDGDLVWDEFLGPREAFHRLDSDGDSLIDAKEAAAYESQH
ncbi:MAG: hypothetical protein ACTHK7_20135 [Aureliella sp.]